MVFLDLTSKGLIPNTYEQFIKDDTLKANLRYTPLVSTACYKIEAMACSNSRAMEALFLC